VSRPNTIAPHALTRRGFLASSTAATLHASASFGQPTPPEKRFSLIGFTKPFQHLSFDETADTVAEIGWDGIECPVRPKGQIEPERAADELPRLIESLRKRGKELTLLTTGITSLKQPHAELLLRTAAKLGIKRYRMGFVRYNLQRPVRDQLEELRAQFRDLAALNAELGLQAGYQNHSGRDYFGGPVWDICSILNGLDPRQLGICFDIGHATIEGGLSWPIEARLAQPHLAAVFVKDFTWQRTAAGWREQWVLLGDGMVDRSFFRWLKTTSFSGPISQHHEYDHGQGKEMIGKLQRDLKVLRDWLES
jgi:sugar phosphate isomerase/epimerase